MQSSDSAFKEANGKVADLKIKMEPLVSGSLRRVIETLAHKCKLMLDSGQKQDDFLCDEQQYIETMNMPTQAMTRLIEYLSPLMMLFSDPELMQENL